MCASCLAHLLADARLKDETATCPNCRCEISKTLCIRNLAVEKAISELPSECRFCSQQLPRCQLDHHERELCQERYVSLASERSCKKNKVFFQGLFVQVPGCSAELEGCAQIPPAPTPWNLLGLHTVMLFIMLRVESCI